MNPKLKIFLNVCYLAILAIPSLYLYSLFIDPLINKLILNFTSQSYKFIFSLTASEICSDYVSLLLGFSGLLCLACIVLILSNVMNKEFFILSNKITNNHQSFINDNDADSFYEIYDDPTISNKDKILFFLIYSIYYAQLPFLYCISKMSDIQKLAPNHRILELTTGMLLFNSIMLVPTIVLELIKYPLIKFFSPLGLGIKQFSFMFNVSDLDNRPQSVHTSSFESSIHQCTQELQKIYGNQSNILNEKFAKEINESSEFTVQQKAQLKQYLNFDNSNTSVWRESRTNLTLTQAVNLVLTAAHKQNLDMDLLKGILLIRLQEGNGQCYLGMFNRIIYSLSCLEAKNNFQLELNSQMYEKISGIAKEFLQFHCRNKKIIYLKENFNNFYSEKDISDEIRNNINYIVTEVKEFIFKKCYVHYYERYGKEVNRATIRDKLKELITNDEAIESINSTIDEVEIYLKPTSSFMVIEVLQNLFQAKKTL